MTESVLVAHCMTSTALDNQEHDESLISINCQIIIAYQQKQMHPGELAGMQAGAKHQTVGKSCHHEIQAALLAGPTGRRVEP